ncbi:hypothetical protein NDA11_007940 [Ustilago hordei]|uniref:Uncharacterized protein n=1 Tax=Ustilago hordei TaxID=120017 RepID=I2G331_USTHO|nr:uncharacterized protein UHO2_02783 [Ustilago hordei]KAJ1040469.1 hypothetical protein NDA10_006593 [Ustilago hordei]KAJ1585105.1 hypothetical protein NDA15_002909 [Ustilago hordei]KAJ1587780.1 hypothetical protein NDA12_000644 [Ustilago hordei]KAJ1593371.1 hypothetical protein NDA11_007940 [Ustilago hordei]KAJ1601347.1 hypothetical protein NDA14_001561 [Ustilago hordei]
MGDRSNSVSLVIDTSRRSLKNQGGSVDTLDSPTTSYPNTSLVWSTSTSTTPSTGLTSTSAYDHNISHTRRSIGTSAECIITKIDEYLADLQMPISSKSVKAVRRSLTINIDPKELAFFEQALPSSPDAMKSGNAQTSSPPPSARPRRLSMPSSPFDFENGLPSPFFYRCFAKQDGKIVLDDAAPFPYSPCREDVCIESASLYGSILGRLDDYGSACPIRTDEGSKSTSKTSSRPTQSPESVGKSQAHETPSQAEVELPSIRFDAVDESDTPSTSGGTDYGCNLTPRSSPLSLATSVSSCDNNDCCGRPTRETSPSRSLVDSLPRNELGQVPRSEMRPATADRDRCGSSSLSHSPVALRPSPSLRISATAPSPTHEWSPLLRPSLGSHRGLSRSASAGNLPRLSTGPTSAGPPVAVGVVRRADSGSSGSHTVRFASTTSTTSPSICRQKPTAPSPPSPRKADPLNTSPTSTQIIEGVRKLNKLKKLLGEEVSSHITPASQQLRRVDRMKPLPLLPYLPLQRSNTSLTTITTTATHSLSINSRTMLGSYKRRDKKPCSASTSSTNGRPSTARDARCTCPNCAEVKQASQNLLTGLNRGGGGVGKPRLRIETKRPGTGSSLKPSG